jgi:hypothetical protein
VLRRPWCFLLCLLLAFSMFLPAGWVGAGSEEIPPPQPMGNVISNQLPPPSEDTTPGTWFLGATPANADPNKLPIVFVQGMNGKAQNWWNETNYHGLNDMYETAYNHGYRTAFVQLYDAGGKPSSQWDNGELLARMLKEIYDHFGQKVNIVAHSKGGPDTQAALIHYGAYPYVSKVVTLGSPHHGSHLADLAHSSWAGWLAELLGQRSDATYSLQTGEMAKYREQTDSHPDADKNVYYTAAGTNWGPSLSALWFGGFYLSSHGDNDGLVNVWSTELPYGNHLFTKDVDHDAIRTGSVAFAEIDSVLRSGQVVQTRPDVPRMTEESADHFVRGGPLTAGTQAEETIPVDAGSEEILFTVLTKSPEVEVRLTSPSGKVYTETSGVFSQATDETFFQGAAVQMFHLKGSQVESGNWTMQMNSPQTDAYLLITTYSGTDTLSFTFPAKADSGRLPLQMNWKNTDLKQLQGSIQVISPRGEKIQTEKITAGQIRKNVPDLADRFGLKEPGTYNVTIDLQGTKADGTPFARTIIRSVYIGKQ